jgi:hypothetical protein
MARTSTRCPSRRHRTLVVAIAAGAAVMVAAHGVPHARDVTNTTSSPNEPPI